MDGSSKASSVPFLAVYLAAIIVANLLAARFGALASIANAFFFIGLDLTVRDHLHSAWRRRGLVWRMGALIALGSILTWLVQRDAGRIAMASCAAFAAAAAVDAIIYHLLEDRAHLIRVNGSNAWGAIVDSLVFPTIAFGAPMPWIVLGHFVAKVAGGFFWSLILIWPRDARL